jgi:hypothetical protein
MRNIPNGCAYKPELWNSWEEHSLSWMSKARN